VPNPLHELIAEELESFLFAHPEVIVVEEGELLFDMRAANYSLIDEGDRCLMQLWSDERSIVRRLIACERTASSVQLRVQRLGRPKPNLLTFCPAKDRLSPSARRLARERTLAILRRTLSLRFVDWRIDNLRVGGAAVGGLGPACIHGELSRGSSRLSVVAFSSCETQATLDDSIAAAILALEGSRARASAKASVEGSVIFLPAGRSLSARLRLSALDRSVARWRLFELDEATGEVEEMDLAAAANLELRLPRCTAQAVVEERLSKSLALMHSLSTQVEVRSVAASELSFRIHGLEFARARLVPEPGGFRLVESIVFGLARQQCELTENNLAALRLLIRRLELTRARRDLTHPLCHAQPERWLESLLIHSLELIDSSLVSAPIYEQTPVLAAADRSILDLLAVNRAGRLVVIELKASEDLCLPLQGLDYWARVAELHRRGAFQREGYFAGRELSSEPPLLYLVAPCLHLHPRLKSLLRHLSPEIDWRLIGLDERWRDCLRVVLRRDRARLLAE